MKMEASCYVEGNAVAKLSISIITLSLPGFAGTFLWLQGLGVPLGAGSWTSLLGFGLWLLVSGVRFLIALRSSTKSSSFSGGTLVALVLVPLKFGMVTAEKPITLRTECSSVCRPVVSHSYHLE